MLKKIVLAPDSFKSSMTSMEVCQVMTEAIGRIDDSIETVSVPIADGGEGTVDAFLEAVGGQKVSCNVRGPLWQEVEAGYGILPDRKTAVIEMAAASGLPLCGEKKDPTLTTTHGTGELMADALDRGCRKLIIGIGGSATNDGGLGMAAALGYRLTDDAGKPVPLCGAGLIKLRHVDAANVKPELFECQIEVACDVDNPLFGPQGAAAVFGPQKGADPAQIDALDRGLRHYAKILQKEKGLSVESIAGGGAAGGLGAGLVAFADARLKPGIQIVLDTVGFDRLIEDADLIFTGEGQIDGQSLRGKVPVGIARRAGGKAPVIAVVGDVGDGLGALYEAGIGAIFSINRVAVPFAQAKKRSRSDLKATMEDIMRLLRISQRF